MPWPDRATRAASKPVDAGAAWLEVLGRTGTGKVLAAVTEAIYVQVDAAVLAVVARPVPPGPIHLRVDALPLTEVGGPMVVDPSGVTIGDSLLDTRALGRWQPPVVDSAGLAAVAPTATARLNLASQSPLALDPAVDLAQAALQHGDAAAAVAALAGRGAGLTPAGDDVLAGAFVVLAVGGAAHSWLGPAAASARTHPVARAFLVWAARGQSIEPVHRLLVALAAGDDDAVGLHQEQVASLGHSSGVDMLLGLRVGFSALA